MAQRLQRVSFIIHPCMHLCLHVHRGPCPQDFFGKYRLQSEVKLILAIILHLYVCIHPCMCPSLCVRVHMYTYLYIIIIMCSAGPEVAVLDWYGLPEADPVYWRRGRGGGRTSGSVWSTHSRGESIGAPPPPKKLDHLILIIYPVLQIFSVGSHWQGIVISYLPSTPISLSCLCNSSSAITVYKVHYCVIIKHARSSNNYHCPQNNQNYSYIHARALKKSKKLVN